MIFNLFKKKNLTTPKKNEEAVIIYLDAMNLSDEVYETCDLMTLEDKINEVILFNQANSRDLLFV